MPSRLIAYRLSDRTRDSGKDFTTLDAAGNFSPNGLALDANNFYVGDTGDRKIYAYNRLGSSFPLHADNSTPRGIWATSASINSATMYVLDAGTTKKVFAYNYLSAVRDATKEFNLHTDNANPSGCWGDDINLYVLDEVDDRVYVYRLSDGVRQTALEWATADATSPRGIWGNYTHFFITDRTSTTIRAYLASTKTRDSSRDLDLSTDNQHPTGITGNGIDLFVCDDTDNIIYCYDFLAYAARSTRDIKTLGAVGNTEPEDCFMRGNTMFVSDRTDNRLYLYTILGTSEFTWERT